VKRVGSSFSKDTGININFSLRNILGTDHQKILSVPYSIFQTLFDAERDVIHMMNTKTTIGSIPLMAVENQSIGLQQQDLEVFISDVTVLVNYTDVILMSESLWIDLKIPDDQIVQERGESKKIKKENLSRLFRYLETTNYESFFKDLEKLKEKKISFKKPRNKNEINITMKFRNV